MKRFSLLALVILALAGLAQAAPISLDLEEGKNVGAVVQGRAFDLTVPFSTEGLNLQDAPKLQVIGRTPHTLWCRSARIAWDDGCELDLLLPELLAGKVSVRVAFAYDELQGLEAGKKLWDVKPAGDTVPGTGYAQRPETVYVYVGSGYGYANHIRLIRPGSGVELRNIRVEGGKVSVTASRNQYEYPPGTVYLVRTDANSIPGDRRIEDFVSAYLTDAEGGRHQATMSIEYSATSKYYVLDESGLKTEIRLPAQPVAPLAPTPTLPPALAEIGALPQGICELIKTAATAEHPELVDEVKGRLLKQRAKGFYAFEVGDHGITRVKPKLTVRTNGYETKLRTYTVRDGLGYKLLIDMQVKAGGKLFQRGTEANRLFELAPRDYKNQFYRWGPEGYYIELKQGDEIMYDNRHHTLGGTKIVLETGSEKSKLHVEFHPIGDRPEPSVVDPKKRFTKFDERVDWFTVFYPDLTKTKFQDVEKARVKITPDDCKAQKASIELRLFQPPNGGTYTPVLEQVKLETRRDPLDRFEITEESQTFVRRYSGASEHTKFCFDRTCKEYEGSAKVPLKSGTLVASREGVVSEA